MDLNKNETIVQSHIKLFYNKLRKWSDIPLAIEIKDEFMTKLVYAANKLVSRQIYILDKVTTSNKDSLTKLALKLYRKLDIQELPNSKRMKAKETMN